MKTNLALNLICLDFACYIWFLAFFSFVNPLLTRAFYSLSLFFSCDSDSFDLKLIHCLNQMPSSSVLFFNT